MAVARECGDEIGDDLLHWLFLRFQHFKYSSRFFLTQHLFFPTLVNFFPSKISISTGIYNTRPRVDYSRWWRSRTSERGWRCEGVISIQPLIYKINTINASLFLIHYIYPHLYFVEERYLRIHISYPHSMGEKSILTNSIRKENESNNY